MPPAARIGRGRLAALAQQVRQHHGGTARGAEARGRLADALRRAGDEDDLSVRSIGWLLCVGIDLSPHPPPLKREG